MPCCHVGCHFNDENPFHKTDMTFRWTYPVMQVTLNVISDSYNAVGALPYITEILSPDDYHRDKLSGVFSNAWPFCLMDQSKNSHGLVDFNASGQASLWQILRPLSLAFWMFLYSIHQVQKLPWQSTPGADFQTRSQLEGVFGVGRGAMMVKDVKVKAWLCSNWLIWWNSGIDWNFLPSIIWSCRVIVRLTWLSSRDRGTIAS